MDRSVIGIALPAGRANADQLNHISCAGFSRVALSAEDLLSASLVRTFDMEIDHSHLSFGQVVNDIWSEDSIVGDAARDRLEAELLLAAIFDIDKVVLHLKSGQETIFTDEGIKRHLFLLEQASSLGVWVCFENQSSASHLLSFFEHVACHPAAAICFDFGHAILKSHEDLICDPALRDRIKVVHIHANDRTSDQHRLPMDVSGIPWNSLLSKLRQTGYAGPIMLEPHKGSFYEQLSDKEFYEAAALQAVQLGCQERRIV